MLIRRYNSIPLAMLVPTKIILEKKALNPTTTNTCKESNPPSPLPNVNPRSNFAPVWQRPQYNKTHFFQNWNSTIKPLSSRSPRSMALSKYFKTYNIMEDLSKIQLTIPMKQLLAVTPQYCSSLITFMICKWIRPT